MTARNPAQAAAPIAAKSTTTRITTRLAQLQWLSQHLLQDIHRGIFAQTLLVTLVVALVPSVGLLIAHQRTAALQTKALEQAFETAAIATGLQVDQWLDTNRLALQQLALQQGAASAASLENPERTFQQTDHQTRLLQTRLLQTFVDTYHWSDLAFGVGLDGYQTARSDDKPVLKWDGVKAYFQGDRPYIQQILNGSTNLGSELLISDATGLPALCLAVPMRQQAEIQGAVASCSGLEAIAQAVTQTRIGQTGVAILVDDQNRVIAHGGALRESEQLEDLSDYPALKTERLETPTQFTWRAQNVTAYVKPVGLEGWKLIVQQKTAEAEQPIVRARWHTFWLMGATGGLTLLLAYGFSRRLVRPLQSLTAGADAVSRGQLEVEIAGVDRQDEIGALARSVKRLAASVAIAFDELS